MTPEERIASGIRPVGQPSKYKENNDTLAYKLCLLGATDEDLAAFFEVATSTIYLWKLDHPTFAEQIRAGKKVADMHIAHKLFNRAEGAEWIEEQAFKVKRDIFDNAGKKIATQEEIITVPVRKAAPPDTTAIIFWLKNRDPAKWRDRVDATLLGDKESPLRHVVNVASEVLKHVPTEALESVLNSSGPPDNA